MLKYFQDDLTYFSRQGDVGILKNKIKDTEMDLMRKNEPTGSPMKT